MAFVIESGTVKLSDEVRVATAETV